MNEHKAIIKGQHIIFLYVVLWGSLIMSMLEKNEGHYVFAVILFLIAFFCGVRAMIESFKR